MANRTKWTSKKEEQFFDKLREGKSVSDAALFVGVSRSACYDRRDSDKAFEAAWDDAVEEGTDKLEDEAMRRASEGWLEPVHYLGVKVGEVRKYSDTLLIFLLKGRRPAKYAERKDITSGGKRLKGYVGISPDDWDDGPADQQ